LTYPKWKLSKLGEYTGNLSNKVFEYLDAISRPEETYYPQEEIGYKQLPDSDNYTKQEKECGAKLFKGISEIMANPDIGKTAKQRISELHAQLRAEYPKFERFLKC
jgi:hypothetical protein